MTLVRPTVPKPPRDSAAPRDDRSRARLFASIMANAKDAILVTEAEPYDLASGGPRILYVNEAFTAMTGYSAEEAIGQTPRMLQSPRTDQRELDRIRHALDTWQSVEVELLNVHKDGGEFWVQFILVPVADEDGWFTHWVSVQRDITSRRQREEELAAMVRESSEVVVLARQDGSVRNASPAAERRLRLAPGGDLTALLVEEDREVLRGMLRDVRELDARDLVRELRLRTVDAGERWFETSLRLGHADEQVVGVVLTAVDVTERREAQAALRRAQERFTGAFADAPIGMAVVDPQGAVLEVNAQLCRLMGREERDLLGAPLDGLVHPDDRDAASSERLQVLAGTRAVGRHETRMLHRDGRVVGVMLSSSVVRRHGTGGELVVHVEDISERKALEARLTHQAMHDGLTGLPNRALLIDRLQVALQRTARERRPVSVLFLDLDRFKAINDAYGHEAGDEVLAAVAARLGALVGPADTAARFGGDEFVVLCDGADARQALAFADRVAEALGAPILSRRAGALSVRTSVGVATADGPGVAADGLLRDADMAMYAAKERPDVPARLFEESLRTRTAVRLDEERELQQALREDELELWFQPIFDLVDGSGPVEHEALVRWRHPQRGLLAPAAFIGLAERSGLIVDLDRWVLRRAARHAAASPAPGGKVWVNLSLRTLDEPGLADEVEDLLRAEGLEPSGLGVEVTERAVVDGGPQIAETVARLRRIGLELAADDFGTGYSSLASLIERPVDVLKIDRSFVDGLPGDTSTAVVRAIVAMAAALGLRTVAEGVERDDQLAAVRELGCERVQGYLLARPTPSADLDSAPAGRAAAPAAQPPRAQVGMP